MIDLGTGCAIRSTQSPADSAATTTRSIGRWCSTLRPAPALTAQGEKQEMIDIIETVFRGASKGRGLVVSPKDYSTRYRY